MIGDVDGEDLIAEWLGDRLQLKTWSDPALPHEWDYAAPIGWVQRGADVTGSVLSVDAGLYDITWYAADPDHARQAAGDTRTALMLDLPLHTFGNGIVCKGVTTFGSPAWLRSPTVVARTATYRIVLHGFVRNP